MKSKLAYLCSSQSWGGLEMNHARNAKWMQELGYQSVFFCVKGSPLDKYVLDLDIDLQYIEPHKKYYDFKKAKILTSLLQEGKFTHLLIRSTSDMSITATVKRKLGAAIHTSYFMEMQLGVKKTHFLHSLRFGYIDVWSCPLNWLHHQVKTMTHFKNECVVIPSGLDLSQFGAKGDKKVAREQLNLPPNSLIFGLIGRFDPQKGQLLLLRAMKKTNNTNFEILLLGEPTLNEGDAYYEKMQRTIKEEGIENRVHIRPFMKDVSVFFSAVDWFVMATKAETFGMVTIESLASGTPVLGSNAGGTPEILDGEKGGRLFTTQDAKSLAKTIDTIIDSDVKINPNELREMAKQYDHSKVCKMVAETLHLSKN